MGNTQTNHDDPSRFMLSARKTWGILAGALIVQLFLFGFLVLFAFTGPDYLSKRDDFETVVAIFAIPLIFVVACFLFYPMWFILRMLIKKQPFAVIGSKGIEAHGYFGWKRFEWSQVTKVEDDEEALRVRGCVPGARDSCLFINYPYLKMRRPEVLKTFNRFCPDNLKIQA